MSGDCAPGSGVTINMFENGTPIPNFDIPGPQITVNLPNPAGSTLDRSIRRLKNKDNLAGGYDWFTLDGTPKAEPVEAANYVYGNRYRVAHSESTEIGTLGDTATWVAAWGLVDEPVEVWIIGHPSGEHADFSLMKDTNGNWSWHQNS